MTAAEQELTVTEAAMLTGMSRDTVLGWIRLGHLPARRQGRSYIVREADVRAAQQTRHLGTIIPSWRADPRHAGARLRFMREAAGLSQLQLAARTGLSHEYLSRLEHGRLAPTAATLLVIADALTVEPVRFVADDTLGLTRLSAAEAAQHLQVPTSRVVEWLRCGEVAGHKVAGRWRILAITVLELERSGRLRGQSRRLDPRFRG